VALQWRQELLLGKTKGFSGELDDQAGIA